ncbi:hypothetical protein BZA05DRAFT_111015 [Tricharina praecox]|uniref:uncharacterized protein n=1 Tax=Tricharina praecox TaxID=43433 RepID=UPI002220A21B|nr:uncharacterized protein BZA05DRAFT_111015 [Tricharina praecox]KAI5857965.1 hypothetical protein BZA05DRAFT_111015 [Tricharina praecox]
MDGWKCSNFKVDGYGFALRSPRHRYLFASLCEPRSQRFASILSGSTVSGPRRAACRVGESDMPNSWLTIHTNLRSGLRYRRIMQSYWYICMILYILAYIPVIRLTQCVEITMALWTCGGWVQKRKKKPLLPEAGATMVTWVKYLSNLSHNFKVQAHQQQTDASQHRHDGTQALTLGSSSPSSPAPSRPVSAAGQSVCHRERYLPSTLRYALNCLEGRPSESHPTPQRALTGRLAWKTNERAHPVDPRSGSD